MHAFTSLFSTVLEVKGMGKNTLENAYSTYRTDNKNNEIEDRAGRIRVEIFAMTLVRK